MRRFFHRAGQRIKGATRGRAETRREIVCGPDGVKVHGAILESGAGSATFSWDLVLRVQTFKRDLFAVDLICLAIEMPEGCVEIDEEMQGWDELLKELEQRLPGFPRWEEWWSTVAFPPFATNQAELWVRKTPEDDA